MNKLFTKADIIPYINKIFWHFLLQFFLDCIFIFFFHTRYYMNFYVSILWLFLFTDLKCKATTHVCSVHHHTKRLDYQLWLRPISCIARMWGTGVGYRQHEKEIKLSWLGFYYIIMSSIICWFFYVFFMFAFKTKILIFSWNMFVPACV